MEITQTLLKEYLHYNLSWLKMTRLKLHGEFANMGAL
jgi:hypothetical protein